MFVEYRVMRDRRIIQQQSFPLIQAGTFLLLSPQAVHGEARVPIFRTIRLTCRGVMFALKSIARSALGFVSIARKADQIFSKVDIIRAGWCQAIAEPGDLVMI